MRYVWNVATFVVIIALLSAVADWLAVLALLVVIFFWLALVVARGLERDRCRQDRAGG